ncbi:MAG: lipoyl(octanoyl) transferase LipB [Gemmatimonadetes bacterium]|nr:lipoyl(octanoyl) transferase LipB [Gemmatimonadota bacterium]
MATRRLLVADLGVMPYADALALQRAAAKARLSGSLADDLLLVVEHPPVITLGRSTKAGNLLASSEQLAARGVELFEVERGGDVTFHGPGQLVGYPIVNLERHTQDLHWYLRQLEEVMIRALASFDIAATRNPGKTGVWVRNRKIASIGVHARQWVTWHGFALNVTTDLSYFDLMIPCGIPDVVMTSVERELLEAATGVCLAPSPALYDDVRSRTIAAFANLFALTPVAMDATALRALLQP